MLLVARRPGNQNTPTLTRPNCKIKTRSYLSQAENFLLCNHTQPQPQPSTVLLGATRDSTIHHCIADRRRLLLLLLQPKTKPSQYPLLRRYLRHDSGFRLGFVWEAAAAAATRSLIWVCMWLVGLA
jgi:hypothetical protein